MKLIKKAWVPDDLELDEFEFCDEYCKFQTQTLYAKPEDEKESSEIEEKEKLLRAYEKRVALSREIAELNKQKKEAEEQIKKGLNWRPKEEIGPGKGLIWIFRGNFSLFGLEGPN